MVVNRHTSIDPISASAQIVNQIQTIVSRNLNPFDSAVISVCSIQNLPASTLPLRMLS